MKAISKWVLMLLPLLFAAGASAEAATEEATYKLLANEQPTASADKVEVVELFWYGCPHCHKLEPELQDWLAKKPDDVEFIRIPAILGPRWELFAKAFYTSDLLDVTDKIHPALFAAIHEDRKKIDTVDKVKAFFVDHGVSAEDFDKTFKSFAVAIKLNNARMMTRRYGISGVPTIIINGKYSTGPSMTGGNKQVIKVIDQLIAQERKQLAVPSAPAAVSASE